MVKRNKRSIRASQSQNHREVLTAELTAANYLTWCEGLRKVSFFKMPYQYNTMQYPRDIEILSCYPVGSILPHWEKVSH